MKNYTTDITNVLVIGCGGAGLRSAIEVKKKGLSVKVLGKRPKSDAHTVLAAGGINASFGNLDAEDNWLCHFSDTYLEGYEIGDPQIIEIMTKKSPELVDEIDSWGANFAKLDDGKMNQRYFGAHTYRRTCFAGDYTGQAILNALLKKSAELKIPIFDSQYVFDLLIHEKSCFGAVSINIINGEITVHLADAVILCSGGHTRIWSKSSSRNQENTGDGYHLALKAGCSLIDMEMVQFHPTGMILPTEFAGTLVTEAVRGEGGKLFNGNGERFMINYDKKRLELSTRDKVAIANYTEIEKGRSTPNGGVYLDISHKDKDFIIEKIPKIYRQFIDLQMLDITKSPMEVAPTAHYSMGGIKVSSDEHSTEISGLFAAGEVAGGLHGANRLGGNSLAEILVFGKSSGNAAVEFSRNLTCKTRSLDVIRDSIDNIFRHLKKGDEIVNMIQYDLRELMWENCGVVRNKYKLNEGIKKLNQLKLRSERVDVRVSDNNFQDLINLLDLEASLISAESTIKSALAREESRGSHYRSDFPMISKEGKYNLNTTYKNNSLTVKKIACKNLNAELNEYVKKHKQLDDLTGKLIE